MKILQIILCSLVLFATSCNKKTGNINPYIGTWKVKLETTTYDQLGKEVSKVIDDDGSTIEISKDEVDINAHPVKVTTTFSKFEPVGYVLTQGNGGVFFAPDINNNRINFWYYGWSSAVSQTATIISRKSNTIVLGAVRLFANSNATNKSMEMMQTLTLTK